MHYLDPLLNNYYVICVSEGEDSELCHISVQACVYLEKWTA